MREIKFRVWSEQLNKMTYPNEHGFFKKCYIGENGYAQTCSLGIVVAVNGDKLKLMQYTGLKDKNGVEIYEGDIVRWLGKCKGYIDWNPHKSEYWLNIDGERVWSLGDMRNDIEVIGNIYENPELIKEG